VAIREKGSFRKTTRGRLRRGIEKNYEGGGKKPPRQEFFRKTRNIRWYSTKSLGCGIQTFDERVKKLLNMLRERGKNTTSGKPLGAISQLYETGNTIREGRRKNKLQTAKRPTKCKKRVDTTSTRATKKSKNSKFRKKAKGRLGETPKPRPLQKKVNKNKQKKKKGFGFCMTKRTGSVKTWKNKKENISRGPRSKNLNQNEKKTKKKTVIVGEKNQKKLPEENWGTKGKN